LEAIAREVILIVKMMDGFNRGWFARDSEALAAWNSARKVMERTERADTAERVDMTETDQKTAA
jgi:hypothetical protein